MVATVLKGGTVVNADSTVTADVVIADGRIVVIGRGADVPAGADVVDVSGRYVLPGGVDVHTHLESTLNGVRTADDFETGTIAAAVGGTTTIVDFAAQEVGLGLLTSLDKHLARAEGKAVVDYGMHLCVTDLATTSVEDMAAAVARGVTSFKVFMAYRGTVMLNDAELFRVFREAGRLGAVVCVHAENGDLIDELAAENVALGHTGAKGHYLSRPPITEVEAVDRAIRITTMTEANIYFVHLSTKEALAAVARARGAGLRISAETCTHYLTLDASVYDEDEATASRYIISPPLREKLDRDALWEGVRLGQLTAISSDHCPYCTGDKYAPEGEDFRTVPNGGPGIEHRLNVIYGHGVAGGRIGIEKFVDITATAPARRFGLHPRKGAISVGSDADIVVLDPQDHTTITEESQKQAVDYTPYEGWTLPGRIERVYARGDLVALNGEYVGERGRGRFLARAAVHR